MWPGLSLWAAVDGRWLERFRWQPYNLGSEQVMKITKFPKSEFPCLQPSMAIYSVSLCTWFRCWWLARLFRSWFSVYSNAIINQYFFTYKVHRSSILNSTSCQTLHMVFIWVIQFVFKTDISCGLPFAKCWNLIFFWFYDFIIQFSGTSRPSGNINISACPLILLPAEEQTSKTFQREQVFINLIQVVTSWVW
jgi:hypothetical protein